MPDNYEYQGRRKDGTLIWLESHVRVVDWEGAPATQTTLIDITGRKHAEEAIARSEAHLNQAQHIANVGSWEYQARSENLIWSDEVYRIFGVCRDSFQPTFNSFMQCVHPDDRDSVLKEVEKEAQGIEEVAYVHRIVRPNGEIRTIREVSVALASEGGIRTLRSGTAQDITEQASTEEQLRQAQKMEVVGQLTGGVAHDFNNLLTVILGNLELAGDDLDGDSAAHAMILRAMKASDRAAKLTHQLLAFSRKQTLMPSAIDAGKLAADMSDMLRRTLGEAIEIRTGGQAGLWPCRADPSQLENALLNLAINARDAMANGGRLTVETGNLSFEDEIGAAEVDVEAGDYVILSVSDNGCGIAGKDLKHVFEPFFTTKEVGEGPGLGLSMVYGFAKQSGGNVTIDSESGVGTTVKLYLPRAVEQSNDRLSGRAKPDIPLAQGENILIVEDDAEVRALAVAIISGLGYGTVEAGSAEAALEIMQHSAAVDLLLSDVVLSGAMNGPDLAAEVRRRSPATKLVYMTGHAKEALDHRAGLDESTHVIQKPFKKAELASVIRGVLDEE